MQSNTSSNELPSFNSYDLHKAVEAASEKLNLFQNDLNRISEDIKKLEGHLVRKGINVPARVLCAEEFNVDRITEDMDFGAYGYGTLVEHYVSWEETEKSGFRLMYTHLRQQNCARTLRRGNRVPHGDEGEVEIVEKRPLIETKAAVRMQAHEHLPKLVEALSGRINISCDTTYFDNLE